MISNLKKNAAILSLFSVLILAGCSSDDDDDDTVTEGETAGETTAGETTGGGTTGGTTGETGADTGGIIIGDGTTGGNGETGGETGGNTGGDTDNSGGETGGDTGNGGNTDGDTENGVDNGNTGGDNGNGGETSTDFNVNVSLQERNNLTQGDTINFPINIERLNGYDGPITFEIRGNTDYMTLRMMGPDGIPDPTGLTIDMAIEPKPILSHIRNIEFVATSNSGSKTVNLPLTIHPARNADVYLLVGQDNMAGNSGNGTKDPTLDTTNKRIYQLNVTPNDPTIYPDALAYSSLDYTIVEPHFYQAEDPLHDPQNDKGTNIGMGLSFAKVMEPEASSAVVLVPAAWPSSSFCNNAPMGGPLAHWNAEISGNTSLGNDLLYERALVRVNQAIKETYGVLRGIIWHQGESDSNERCAPLYQENLNKLMTALRTNIIVDARGEAARGSDSDVPVVVGTMSRGKNEQTDYSQFDEWKTMVDTAHKTIADWLPHSGVVNMDDVTPFNGWRCETDVSDPDGSVSDCIHFGPEALREMGRRYAEVYKVIE